MIQQSEFILFGDESGNTGPDLLSTEQPFFVNCLLLLSPAQEEALKTSVSALRSEYPKLIVAELKFSKLGRTRMGLGAVRKIGLALKSAGAQLFFGITEKRYLACHLLLETFFDSALNPRAPPELSSRLFRRWVCNKLYETVQDRLLANILAAIQLDDVEATRRVGESVVSQLRLHPDDRVELAAKQLAAGLENFHRFGMRLPGAPPLTERPSPAATEFMPWLEAINQELALEQHVARIVSDVDAQFGPLVDFALALAKNPECFDENGVSPYGVRGPFKQILERKQAPSETTLGIQLADIGAGLVNRIATEAKNGHPIEPTLANAWEPFLRLARVHPHCIWWRMSEQCLKTLLKPFAGVHPPLDPA